MTQTEIVELAAKIAIEHLEAEREKQKKTKRDRRLRNTKLLLKHYRALKKHCADEKNMTIKSFDEYSEELDTEDLALVSITRSKKRSQLMIQFIDRMLEVYRISCEQSNNTSSLRQYKTIKLMYISDDPMTVEEISEEHFVDVRTVYRDSKEAIYSLSSLIFGVDGIRMFE